MDIINLPVNFNNQLFRFHRILGVLLVDDAALQKPPCKIDNLKLKIALPGIENPFKLLNTSSQLPDVLVGKFTKVYAFCLNFVSRKSFLMAKLFLLLPAPSFPTTEDAIAAYREIFPGKQQKLLCLPRTLFVVKTSRSFKKSGVAFIGVFLPSRKMHAWIIENNCNPDPFDDIWICYQPVAALI